MTRLVIITFVLGFLAGPAGNAFGWGAEAHEIITRSATLTLPDETRLFFTTCRGFLAVHSNDPDTWKHDRDEKARHFCDIDHYGSPPFAELPREFHRAVGEFGLATLKKRGTLPWRIAEYTEKLTASMRREDWGQVRLDAAHLAHYVADAHMPFHCTKNYNGQLTGNLGIHGRLEIELVHRYLSARFLLAKGAAYVADPRAFAFQIVIESQRLTAPLLRADTRVRAKAPLDTARYYALLHAEVGDTIRGRMAAAATAIGSLWQTAWVGAGKPRMPPRRAMVILIDREQFEPEAMSKTALKLLDAALPSLDPHDAVAVRIANGPKRLWERGIVFRHAIDCREGKKPSRAGSFTINEAVGLDEAVAALSDCPNVERRLILISDGLPKKVVFDKLASRLRRHKIQLRAISVRPEADRQIRSLSRHAHGRFDRAKGLHRAALVLRRAIVQ